MQTAFLYLRQKQNTKTEKKTKKSFKVMQNRKTYATYWQDMHLWVTEELHTLTLIIMLEDDDDEDAVSQ